MTSLGVHTSKKQWKIENRSEKNGFKIWNICLVRIDVCSLICLLYQKKVKRLDHDILIPTCGEDL